MCFSFFSSSSQTNLKSLLSWVVDNIFIILEDRSAFSLTFDSVATIEAGRRGHQVGSQLKKLGVREMSTNTPDQRGKRKETLTSFDSPKATSDTSIKRCPVSFEGREYCDNQEYWFVGVKREGEEKENGRLTLELTDGSAAK